MIAPKPDRTGARRRRAAQAILASAGIAGGVALAANAASADPVPTPVPEVIDGTLVVRGTDNSEDLALRLSPTDPDALEVDFANDGIVEFVFSRATFERISVELLAGDDQFRVDEVNGVFTDTEATTIDSGDGTDFVLGGGGVETFIGGAGDDFVDGGRGNDIAHLGAGNDQFQWDPGEGSDIVEGDDDKDVMIFNGAGGNEIFDASANGERVRFFRDAGNIVMDLDGVEIIDLDALGGADILTVNDLSGTDLITLNADLEGALGTAVADGQPDTVIVNGTAGDDVAVVSGSAVVDGLPYQVELFNADPALDRLNLNTLAGNDLIEASPLSPGAVLLSVDSGDGDDTVTGSAGNDFVDGGRGTDIAFLGEGDDAFQWDPGEGSDTVQGQGGHDVMVFNGNAANERFEAVANAGRVRFTRDLGTIVMDLDDVEQIDLDALDGRDTLVVRDLTGTDLATLNADLEVTQGSGVGDAQTDFIAVFGTEGDASVSVSGSAGSATVVGLVPTVNITRAVVPDVLLVNGQGGNDTIDASGLAADAIGFGAVGGEGDDTLLGGAGADSLIGDAGNDFADGNRGDDSGDMGPGDDTFQWDPGDGSDIVNGEEGIDRMVFNGNGDNEQFVASADGFGGAVFTRDLGNITMALDRVEQIDLAALGGADDVLVDDLSDFRGTGLETINADLGAGDGQADSVVVNGSNRFDSITLFGGAGSATMIGLPATINVTGAESTLDALTLNTFGATDSIEARGLGADTFADFTVDGGIGNDTFLGGDISEVFLGGPGRDFMLGGNGDDIAILGDGDDSFQWNPGDDNDTIEGQAGVDRMIFNGAGVSETMDVSANGGRVRFFRNIANVTMDLDDVEQIDVEALGGADSFVVNDVSGTDLVTVNVDLEGQLASGAGDGQPDSISVNGTNGDDAIAVSGSTGSAAVSGLAATVNVSRVEPANDRLDVFSLAGNDVIDALGLAADSAQFVAVGGAGDDAIFGGDGDDVLLSNEGDDVIIAGEGDDVLDGGDGDDILIGDGGDDVFLNGEVIID